MSMWDGAAIDQHTLECGVRIGRLARERGFGPVLVLLDCPDGVDAQIEPRSVKDGEILINHLKFHGATEKDFCTVLEVVKRVEAEL